MLLIYANAYIQQGIVIYFEEVPKGYRQNKYIAIWSADEDGCFLEGHKETLVNSKQSHTCIV